MDNLIKFKDPNISDAETIFWCSFHKKDKSITRFDLLKDKETNEIGIGILPNYQNHVDTDFLHFDDIIVLCDDADDFIYDKLTKLMDESITVGD